MSLLKKLNPVTAISTVVEDIRSYNFTDSLIDIQNYDWHGSENKIKRELGALFTDSTAINTTMTPMYAASEIFVAGMSVENSLDARLLAAGVTYAGIGRALGKFRQISSNKFLSENPTEKQQNTHDFLYMGAVGLVLNPAFYLAVGVTDPTEILIGTAAGTAINITAGIPTGYALDWFNDLLGVREASESRMPDSMRKLSSSAKKLAAAGLVGVSVGLTAGIYQAAPEDSQPVLETEPTEIVSTFPEQSYENIPVVSLS